MDPVKLVSCRVGSAGWLIPASPRSNSPTHRTRPYLQGHRAALLHHSLHAPPAMLPSLLARLRCRRAHRRAPRARAQSTESYRAAADRLIAAAMRDSAAWNRSPSSPTGSAIGSADRRLERAIDWILAEMKRDGLENVRGEPVMVPRWVRGAESARADRSRAPPALAMLGLGGSVGTPPGGITAPVLVVTSFDELERAARPRPRARSCCSTCRSPSYGGDPVRTDGGRGRGGEARRGGVLIRSVAPARCGRPHTGAMRYDSTVAHGSPPRRSASRTR